MINSEEKITITGVVVRSYGGRELQLGIAPWKVLHYVRHADGRRPSAMTWQQRLITATTLLYRS